MDSCHQRPNFSSHNTGLRTRAVAVLVAEAVVEGAADAAGAEAEDVAADAAEQSARHRGSARKPNGLALASAH